MKINPRLIFVTLLVMNIHPAHGGTAPATIVINEIHYDEDIKTRRAEFIEIHNATPDAVDLSELRIAFHTSNGVSTPTPEIQSAVRTAVSLLKVEVAKVKEDMPGALETTPGLHAGLMGADAGRVAQQILREAGSPEMDPDLKARIAMMPSEPMPVTELLGTLVDLEDYRRKMMSFMRGYDVMIGPAAPVPAALHHHGYDGFPESGSYSHAYNLAGWPALVIRGGTSPEGMPLGIQVIASPWREDLVLAVGLFLQEALGEFPRPNI